MNKLLLTTLLCAATLAQAHDPGLSELTVCQDDHELEVVWRVHGSDLGVEALRVASSTSAQVQPTEYAAIPEHDQTISRWQFSGVGPDYVLDLVALTEMAHGHRVLATSCAGNQRAVLSRFGYRWSPAATAFGEKPASISSS